VARHDSNLRYGKCIVEREIGRGARSVVYLAWHEGLQIPVAVKVMQKECSRDEDRFSERFTREARIAAQLTHTNIVRVYDCGETEDAYYLVLEYVEGESCRDKMDQWGAFDWQRAVQIVRQVADGLRYAASKGIIHRDLKPENIMIDADGVVHLADLGLAKEVTPGQSSATAEGDVLGTPYYMSPEQVRQPGDVDLRSDVYSLGVTLYHMTTGEVPFEAATPFEIMTMHLNEPLTPPDERREDLPEALCGLIMRMMAKAAEDRYQSYDDLIRDMDALLGGQLPALGDGGGPAAAVDGDVASGPVQTAAFVQAPARATRAAPQPLRPVELPVTDANVAAKLFGLLALTAYAMLLVGIYYLIAARLGGLAGVLASVAFLILALAANVAYGVGVYRGWFAAEPEADLDDSLSAALTRMCARLEIPTPRIHVGRRGEDTCYAYSFFSGRGVLFVPAVWVAETGLAPEQAEALLAQGLAALYTGESAMRMLLALPLALAMLGRRAAARIMRLGAGRSVAFTLNLARGVALAGIVVRCVAVAMLFLLPMPAGLLGMLALATEMLVVAFERQAQYVCDAVALKAVEDEAALDGLIVARGLAGLAPHQLLHDMVRAGIGRNCTGEPLSAKEREAWTERIVRHFYNALLVPDAATMARRLFSIAPSAAERLNELAGLPAAGPSLRGVMSLAGRLYGSVIGCPDKSFTNTADLAPAGFAALLGTGAAAANILTLALLGWSATGRVSEAFFALVMTVLAVVLGCAVAPHACRIGRSAGRLGWAAGVAGVSFCVTSALGLCLVPLGNLPGFAQLCGFGLIPFVLVVALSAGLFARFAPALGVDTHRRVYDARSRTAHTMMMLIEDDVPSATQHVRQRSEEPPSHEGVGPPPDEGAEPPPEED